MIILTITDRERNEQIYKNDNKYARFPLARLRGVEPRHRKRDFAGLHKTKSLIKTQNNTCQDYAGRDKLRDKVTWRRYGKRTKVSRIALLDRRFS